MAAYFYDLECYPNLFLGVFIPLDVPQPLVDEYINVDIYEQHLPTKIAKKNDLLLKMKAKSFTIFGATNQLKEFVAFMTQPDLTLFGFNNNKYDDILANYIVVNYKKLCSKDTIALTIFLKTISNEVIDNGWGYYQLEPSLKGYRSPYISYDILNGLFETVERKPLKHFAVIVRWYRVQDLPLKHDEFIEKSDVYDIADYCVNDTLVSRCIFLHRKEEFTNKIGYSKTYGLNLMNKNRSSIGDAIIAKFYSEATGLKYYEFKNSFTDRYMIKFSNLINPIIKFRDPILVNFHNKLMNTTFIVGQDKFKPAIVFRGTEYQLGVGGIHSEDRPGYFQEDDIYEYWDVDADSYYPVTVANNKICPKHLNQPVFTAIVIKVVTDRIKAKKEGNTSVAGAMKITANSSLFGKFGADNSFLKDRAALYQTTLNCQLAILELIEGITDLGIQVISANTDGVTSKVPKTLKEEYFNVCEQWKNKFHYGVEFSNYSLYIRTSISDYLAMFKSGKIKRKGDFKIDIDVTKGYGSPIMSKAINRYFLENIPLMDTIMNKDGSNSIYDYCLIQGVDKSYQTELHYIDKDNNGNYNRAIDLTQHTFRFIATKKGKIFMKSKSLTNGKKKLISVVAKQYVTAFNMFFPVEKFEDYDLDYRYYHRSAQDIVNAIKGIRTKDMKKYSGSMFDGIE